MRTVCLVGAGSIARIHAEALLAIGGVRIAAVVDPNEAATRRLAAGFGNPAVHGSAEAALAAGGFDAAHVLVPSDLHHAVAHRLLTAGKAVLLEKPLATSSADCAALVAESERRGVPLGVNQNFVFHPAFAWLRRMVEAGRLGRPNFIDCVYNLPLRQIAARQFGHWMFQQPVNLLLEQTVHPLLQILALAGAVQSVAAMPGPTVGIDAATSFHSTLTALLRCERLPVQLRFAVGQEFPFWQLRVVCDDGVVVTDMAGNRLYTHARMRWIEPVDGLLSPTRTADMLAGSGAGNLLDYGLSLLRLKGRSDPFFRSMRGSIAAFQASLAAGRAPELDGRFGGTGFIGGATVAALLDTGATVAVMARSVRGLPTPFADPRVILHRGDIRSGEAVAIRGAPVVVNLAHGGGGGSYAEIHEAMVDGARTVAEACLRQGVRRLVHVGSIASLYLGPQLEAVTGGTPPDPRAEERADYARAKAACDRMLMELHAEAGLPVVILRPGLVVGKGASPFHSGLGFYNTEQHCLGWNAGRNPLPFVLVTEVAAAILVAARAAGIEGRAFNLVGDVRLSAREYVALLGGALGRPLRFHPALPGQLWGGEIGKWLLKRAGGRAAPLPSRRDILSCGLTARFDCSDAKATPGWTPVADRDTFVAQTIGVH